MFKNILRDFKKGFTLVELLVVIGVLGVLAAGLVVLIDPVDKINAANDAKVQNDIGQVAQAESTYAASHDGFYANAIAVLTTAGEFTTSPAAPSGYVAYAVTSLPGGCTSGTTCVSVVVTGTMKSKKFVGPPVTTTRRWESLTGKTCNVATPATFCP